VSDAALNPALNQSLLRALFHFLWEGAAISLALAAAIHGFRPSSARVRYALACLAMFGMLAAFAITVARLWPAGGVPSTAVKFVLHNPAADIVPLPGTSVWPAHAQDRLQWIAPLWIAGVCLLSLRSLVSWIAALRIRRVGVCAPIDAWQRKLAELAQRIRLSRPVTLLESCLAETPSVVGFLRPLILMPAGLLAGFPPDQIEFILLHELAHIRRHDYLVNLLQSLAEDLLFYHPAVWWVSSLIRAERENCCDDVVVAATGNAPGLAAVLAALEQDRWTAREAALAATGGHLMNRIRRLLEGREHVRPAAAPAFAAGLLLAGVALAVAATQQHPPAPVAVSPAAPLAISPITPAPAPVAPQPKPKPRLLAQAQPTPEDQRKANEEKLKMELETPYKKWLNEEVIYIISQEERAAFNSLQTDEERVMFILQFWLRRDPTPNTDENEMRDEHYRRIAYANERFTTNDVPGWKTDRGMIYIKYGPPDELEQHASGGTYQRPPEEGGGTTTVFPFEKWRYRYIEGMGTNVDIEFVDTQRDGGYHMTMDPHEKDALLNVPRAGLTLYEQMGLAANDRLTRPDGTKLGAGTISMTVCRDTVSNRDLCWQIPVRVVGPAEPTK
jgi:GWxTD domain-containing protein